jgi:hypothetical protein
MRLFRWIRATTNKNDAERAVLSKARIVPKLVMRWAPDQTTGFEAWRLTALAGH